MSTEGILLYDPPYAHVELLSMIDTSDSFTGLVPWSSVPAVVSRVQGIIQCPVSHSPVAKQDLQRLSYLLQP